MLRLSARVAFVGLVVAVRGVALGAITLDNTTFDRFLSLPDQRVLVKFDHPYPYGDEQDAFKAICLRARDVPRFFVAEVAIQNYGLMENNDLRERFSLAHQELPVYFLFNGTTESGSRFLGAVTIDALSSWLASAGVAVPPRGTITELDRLVGAYREGGFSRDDIQLAKELAATRHPHDKRSPFYARIMERVNEKGRGFVKTEVARVTKLLSHDMPRAKRAELSNKLVVLDVFDRLLTEV